MKIGLLLFISIFVSHGVETDFLTNTVYKGGLFDLFGNKKVNSTLKACFIITPKNQIYPFWKGARWEGGRVKMYLETNKCTATIQDTKLGDQGVWECNVVVHRYLNGENLIVSTKTNVMVLIDANGGIYLAIYIVVPICIILFASFVGCNVHSSVMKKTGEVERNSEKVNMEAIGRDVQQNNTKDNPKDKIELTMEDDDNIDGKRVFRLQLYEKLYLYYYYLDLLLQHYILQ